MQLIRITLDMICFGMLADDKIIAAAPLAKWSLGKPTSEILAYWHKRGATVEIKEYDPSSKKKLFMQL